MIHLTQNCYGPVYLYQNHTPFTVDYSHSLLFDIFKKIPINEINMEYAIKILEIQKSAVIRSNNFELHKVVYKKLFEFF